MKEQMFVLEEFFIEGRGKQSSHILLNISEPSSSPLGHGYFFALCELTKPQHSDIEHMQSLIDILEDGYCKAEKDDTKSRLEHAIEEANKQYQYQKYNKKTRVNFFVGSLEGNTLYFTTHHSTNAHLFYKKEGTWQTMALGENNESSKNSQFFSAISEGSLRNQDILCIRSNACNTTTQTEELLSVIKKQPAEEILAHITQSCKKQGQKDTYAGMVIYGNTPTQPKPITKDTTTPQKITEDTNTEEDKTDTKSYTTQTLFRNKKSNRHKKSYSPTEHTLIFIGKGLVLIIRTTILLAKLIAVTLGKIIRNVFLIITNHGGQRKTVVDDIKDVIHEKNSYIRTLPIISKILFFLCLISVTIFLLSITFIKHQERIVATKQQHKQLEQAITDKYTAAQASLIYNNEEKALALLDETSTLFAQLPKDVAAETHIQELQNNITTLLGTLQKITQVTPEALFSISEAHPSAQTNHLEKTGDTLIVSGADTTYYTLNPGQPIEKKQTTAAQNILSGTTPKEADKVIFISEDNALSTYTNADQGLTAQDISFPKLTTTIADISIYNRKLYSLDTAESQIYKHSETQTGYDKGMAWIKDTIDLSQATSLTIDGGIYVLKETGEIIKLVRGRQEPFTIKNISPSLTHGTQIWTYNEVPHIFILDTVGKRVIMADKEGNVITQFMSESFANPTSMVVDYEQKFVYVLDTNTVYRFPIEV